MGLIGPALLFTSCFTGSDQEKTFGPTISGLIHRHIGPERLLLWDSKVRGGRPDTMKILKEVYREWNAEGMAHYFCLVETQGTYCRWLFTNK